MSGVSFEPQVSYRALRFGMSLEEAQGTLGRPVRVRKPVDTSDLLPGSEETGDVISYDFDGYRPFHKGKVSLTFEAGRLVAIFLNDAVEPIIFRGMNLFAKDRAEVVRKLFAIDDDLYGNREAGFFGDLGIVLSWPSFVRRYDTQYIEFVDSEYVFAHLEFLTYDQLDEPLR